MYPSGPPGVHRTVSRSAGLELVSLRGNRGVGHSAANRLFGSLRCEILSQKRAPRIAHPTIFLRGYWRGAGALCSSAGPSSRATGGSWYDLRMVRRPGRGVVRYVSSRPKSLEKVVAVRMPAAFSAGRRGCARIGDVLARDRISIVCSSLCMWGIRWQRLRWDARAVRMLACKGAHVTGVFRRLQCEGYGRVC